MKVGVTQDRNAVRVDASAFALTFDVEGVDLPAVDLSFAAWVLLPLAMRRGEDVAFTQPVDPVVLRNANRMGEIWPLLRAEEYRPIRVAAPSGWQPVSRPRDDAVHLYSGGIDSAHTLVTEGRREPQGAALTVLGMDYHLHEEERFRRLLKMTDPLLAHLNYRRIVVRTNFRQVFKGPISNAHAFVFASCLFLLRPLFTRSIMSADCTWEHDMISFDSSNHVTNKYFAGSDFVMETVGAELTRSDKIAALAEHPEVLPALAFCTNKATKPENCGRCSKCIRTKAMFIAATGSIPPIFEDPAFGPRHVSRINVGVTRHYAFFAELVQLARRNGTLDRLHGVEERLVPRSALLQQARAIGSRVLLWAGRDRRH